MIHEVGKCNVCGNPATTVTMVFKDRAVCRDCYIRIAKVVEEESKAMDQQIAVLEDTYLEAEDDTRVQCHHCNGTLFGSTMVEGLFVCRTCNSIVRYGGGDDNE